jgi:hypothetical protein
MADKKVAENIAIIGSGPHSRLLAPFGAENWECWGCSNGNEDIMDKCDLWIEIHHLMRKAAEEPSYFKKMLRHPRLYLQKKDPQIPGSIAYPREVLEERYGSDMLSSSGAFLLALAMHRDEFMDPAPFISAWRSKAITAAA